MRLECVLCAAAVAALFSASARAEEAASKILAMPKAELVLLVGKADATTFERAKAIERLGLVGGDDAIAVLAAQLGNEELNAYARSALEAIGDDAADAALREAAEKSTGRPLVGVLNSIGQRRDEQAVPVLEKHLKSSDAEVRSAAAGALGQIASESAAKALTAALASDNSANAAIGDACLVCADRLAPVARGASMRLYEALVASQAAKPVRLGAMLGRIRLQTDDAGRWIVEMLGQEDLQTFHVGLAAAREISRHDVNEAIARLLPTLPAERQALIVPVLAERKGFLPLPWLVETTRSGSPALQAAAIDVLAELDGADAAKALVEAALGKGAAAALARQRLETLKNPAVDEALIARADQPEQAVNIALIELAGARRLRPFKPLIVELTNHSDLSVQRAAMISLGQLADLEDLDELLPLALLGNPESAGTQAARSALRTAALRLDDREACAARIAKELGDDVPEVQAYLLRLLREMGAGSKTALTTVAEAAKSDDPGLKDAATRELGAWPSAEARDALLDLAKNDAEKKYQIRALRGFIRIARQLQLSDEERLECFHTALEVAQRDEERQLALGILERIPSVATLETATSYLNQPAMASAAGETAVNIAAKLILTEPKAVARAMSQVKKAPGVTLNAKAAQTADALLQRAGGAP